ncbi:MAG: adenylyl-sulfate kinase [Planctomycetota bacterium]
MPTSENIVWSESLVSRREREGIQRQRGGVFWFTGLSGSGKSTIAKAVEQRLIATGRWAYVLDGDNVRHGLNGDLGFSPADRHENLRRIGHVAALFADAGAITLTAFISPYRADRAAARALVPAGDFHEVFIATSLATCEHRDVKGLYARARAGEIADFTGINAPYEPPTAPELAIDTDARSSDACVQDLLAYMVDRGILDPWQAEHDAGAGI